MISNLNKKFLVQTTLLENLKLCPNIQFSEEKKIEIAKLNFLAKKEMILEKFNLDNLNFRAKNRGFM